MKWLYRCPCGREYISDPPVDEYGVTYGNVGSSPCHILNGRPIRALPTEAERRRAECDLGPPIDQVAARAAQDRRRAIEQGLQHRHDAELRQLDDIAGPYIQFGFLGGFAAAFCLAYFAECPPGAALAGAFGTWVAVGVVGCLRANRARRDAARAFLAGRESALAAAVADDPVVQKAVRFLASPATPEGRTAARGGRRA